MGLAKRCLRCGFLNFLEADSCAQCKNKFTTKSPQEIRKQMQDFIDDKKGDNYV